ncbi:MAG: hypothetical protein R3E57_07900 [Porticoccaceae bacterium]
MKKKEVLKGYKKKGAKFIPPMMQIGNIQEVSYLNDALPNLIWMGLVIERYGYRKGVQLIIDFVSIAYEKCADKNGNFSYLCYYSKLDLSLKSSIYFELRHKGILYPLQEALAPLSCLFRFFPALFLKPDFKVDKTPLISRLKTTMKQSMNRYSKMATAIQVTAFYNLAANGKLHIASHIDVPDPNSIFTAPDSDEANRAASFARSNMNTELGFRMDEISEGWVRDFWLQIYKLESCELTTES